MTRRLTLFLALLLTLNLASAQTKCCFFHPAPNDSATTDVNYDTVHFENSIVDHKVRDINDLTSNYAEGYFTMPYGYSTPTWSVYQMGWSAADPTIPRRTLIGTATYYHLKLALPSFHDTGMDSSTLYEVRVHATRSGTNSFGQSYPDCDRTWAGEFRTYPTKITAANADVIIDLATASQATVFAEFDDTWGSVNTSMRKVLVKNANASARRIDIFYKRYPSNKPYQVGFEGASMNSTTNNTLHIGPNEGVIIDGLVDGVSQLSLTHPNTNVSEVVKIEPTDGAHGGKWLWVDGLSIDGQGTGTGLAIQSQHNATFNGDTFSSKGYIISDNVIVDTGNEGSYTGGCCTNTPPYFPLTHFYYFRNRTDNTSNEGYQIGNTKYGEVFKNVWTNSGTAGTPQQDYNHQFNSNDDAVFIYQNYGLTAHQLFESAAGNLGGNVEYFANIAESTLADGSNATFWHFFQNDLHSLVYHNFSWNTMIKKTGVIANLYNDDSPLTTEIHANFNGNAFVSNTTTDHTYNGGYTSTWTIMNNKTYSSPSTSVFFDPTNHNWAPKDHSSSLFTFTTNGTADAAAIHPAFFNDWFGYKRTSNGAAGAVFGFNILQH